MVVDLAGNEDFDLELRREFAHEALCELNQRRQRIHCGRIVDVVFFQCVDRDDHRLRFAELPRVRHPFGRNVEKVARSFVEFLCCLQELIEAVQ